MRLRGYEVTELRRRGGAAPEISLEISGRRRDRVQFSQTVFRESSARCLSTCRRHDLIWRAATLQASLGRLYKRRVYENAAALGKH